MLLRLALSIASIFVASIIVAAAIVSLGVFSYVALLNIVPPPLAAFITILASLVAAVVIVVGGQWTLRRHFKTSKPGVTGNERKRSETDAILEELGGLVGKEAAARIREHPQASALAALAAGFAVGAYPELRALLRRIIAR